MLNLLLELLFVLLLALTTTGLIIFINFCFQKGNVLHWYYKKIDGYNDYISKPLGKCMICFGFWINLIIFTLFAFKFNVNNLFFIPFIGLSEGLLIIYKDLFYED